MLTRAVAYVRGLLTRRRIDREVDDELRFHLEHEIDDYVARGVPPDDARRLALAGLGGLTQTTEAVRALRSSGVSRAWADVRDAWRGLRAGRGATLLAFVVLTLTMTAATVTFSIVDAVGLRQLPYGDPDRLLSLALPAPTVGHTLPVSPQDYFSWLDGTHATLDGVGASRFRAPLQFEIDGVADTARTTSVSANLFDVLRVRPAIGRLFLPEDERPGAASVVVLSHRFWERRFHADPSVIGRLATTTEQIDALESSRRRRQPGAPPLPVPEARRIVGVLPTGVSYPMRPSDPPDVYVPYVPTAADRTNSRGYSMVVVGRMRAGVTLERARADINRVSSAIVQPLQDEVVGPSKTLLLLMLAAAGVVLLVACANVGSVLLARAVTRTRELATREALGASRRRLAGVLLLEGLLLALTAAMAATVLSYWGVEIARTNLPSELLLRRVTEIAIDGRVLAVSIVVAVCCGLVFASAPAWLSMRSELVSLMKAHGGPIVGGRRHARALSAFLVGDVAFVGMLLVAATLVVTTFVRIATTDLGFERGNVVMLDYRRDVGDAAPSARRAAAASVRADLLTRAASVPGVRSVAIIRGPTPLSRSSMGASVTIPGFGETSEHDMPNTHAVTPDYFGVMGIPLLRGRLLRASDRAGAPMAMLINDVAAARYFAGRDPIGQVVIFHETPVTIVGIMRSVSVGGPESEMPLEVYTPIDQEPDVFGRGGETEATGTLVARTTGDPRSLAPVIRGAISLTLGGDPVQTRFLDDTWRQITAVRRFNAMVMAVFGVVAVAIGALGVYGTMAFVVAQQVRTIGLRMALGAVPSRVLWSMLWNALRRVGVGAMLGLTGAWAISSAFTSLVFGVRPTEPLVYAAVAALLALIGLIAAFVPALRAARLDPIAALRDE